MVTKFWLLLLCLSVSLTTSEITTISRGKQNKFFTKDLKSKDVYLGMTLDKFKKKLPEAIEDTVISVFKIKYTEPSEIQGIESYTYLLTQSDIPKLYAIEIGYTSMDNVREHAVEVMGKPNHKGEWRFPAETIKEDFIMGAWTFGQKIVYGSTLEGGEWESGFND